MSLGESRDLLDSSEDDRSMTDSTDASSDDTDDTSGSGHDGEDSGTEESSSDWDVTSSDNDSSDDTTLDIYGRSRIGLISPSATGNFDSSMYYNPYGNINGATSAEPSTSYFDHDIVGSGEPSYRDLGVDHHLEFSQTHTYTHTHPELLKMQTSHYNDPNLHQNEMLYDLNMDLGYYLYSLFYPYTNYQALLFSQQFLYKKEKKLKEIDYDKLEEEEELPDNTEVNMDWNNIDHIKRISGLLERLLKTAGTKGIEEISIYQMFSQPSPLRIIYELRFGCFNNLCITHLDRFGQRTFYYYFDDDHEADTYHFNADITNLNIFNQEDVVGLSDFIHDGGGNKRTSILTINDTPLLLDTNNSNNSNSQSSNDDILDRINIIENDNDDDDILETPVPKEMNIMRPSKSTPVGSHSNDNNTNNNNKSNSHSPTSKSLNISESELINTDNAAAAVTPPISDNRKTITPPPSSPTKTRKSSDRDRDHNKHDLRKISTKGIKAIKAKSIPSDRNNNHRGERVNGKKVKPRPAPIKTTPKTPKSGSNKTRKKKDGHRASRKKASYKSKRRKDGNRPRAATDKSSNSSNGSPISKRIRQTQTPKYSTSRINKGGKRIIRTEKITTIRTITRSPHNGPSSKSKYYVNGARARSSSSSSSSSGSDRNILIKNHTRTAKKSRNQQFAKTPTIIRRTKIGSITKSPTKGGKNKFRLISKDIIVDGDGVKFDSPTMLALIHGQHRRLSAAIQNEQKHVNTHTPTMISGHPQRIIHAHKYQKNGKYHNKMLNSKNYMDQRQFYEMEIAKQTHRRSTRKKKKKSRSRRITIEDMGGAKWCTVQLNHQFLVSGFIRNIANLLPIFLTIPLSIVKLVGMFFYHSSHLVLISGSMECKNTKHNQLHILGISNKKRYKIKLNRLIKPKQIKANGINNNTSQHSKQGQSQQLPPLRALNYAYSDYDDKEKRRNNNMSTKVTSPIINNNSPIASPYGDITKHHKYSIKPKPRSPTSPTPAPAVLSISKTSKQKSSPTSSSKTSYKIKPKTKKQKHKNSSHTLAVKSGKKEELRALTPRKASTPTPSNRKIINVPRKKSADVINTMSSNSKSLSPKKKKKNPRTKSLKFRPKSIDKTKNYRDSRKYLSTKPYSSRNSSEKRTKSANSGMSKSSSNQNENISNSSSSKTKSTKKKRSNKDVSLSKTFDRYALGHCFSTSIALPTWPWLKSKFNECSVPVHERGKYSVIIRSGGTYTNDENVSQENDIIIFNSKHLYHTHTNKQKSRMIVEVDAESDDITNPSPLSTPIQTPLSMEDNNSLNMNNNAFKLKNNLSNGSNASNGSNLSSPKKPGIPKKKNSDRNVMSFDDQKLLDLAKRRSSSRSKAKKSSRNRSKSRPRVNDKDDEKDRSSKKKRSKSRSRHRTRNKTKSKNKTKDVKTKKKRKKRKKFGNAHNNIEVLKYAKPKIINGYYCKLPSFKGEKEYISVIYNEYQSSMFSFGGLNFAKAAKSILELNLSCDKEKNLKWKKVSTLKKPRYSCSLVNCGYYSNQIGVIGGLNSNTKELRHCEIYNMYNKESVVISPMNEGRSNCGLCYIHDIGKGKIIVGGGVKFGDGSKSIEIYDFEKDSWNIHHSRTNYKHSFPTIWCDQINPNIIYIGGDNIGISGGGRNANLGYIEWCDLRESNKKYFNVLYEDSIDRLWRFRYTHSRHHHNAWESRALFCM